MWFFAHFRIQKFYCKNPYNSLCFGMLFWTFAQKVLQKPWKFIGFLNANLENEKVAKTFIKHEVFAHFRIRKFHCKNPYNSLCFGRIFWTFAPKVLQKRWKFMCFRQGETHCKNLIIPYVLEGF